MFSSTVIVIRCAVTVYVSKNDAMTPENFQPNEHLLVRAVPLVAMLLA